jgi:hypothetical protein
VTTPDGLHERGASLWKALGRDLTTADGVLALEACRLADRLDELDSIIAGKGVLNLMSFRLSLDLEDEVTGDRNIHAKVEFSSVLSEARQQQTTFKTLLESLAKTSAAKPAKGSPAAAGQPAEKKGSPLDELARRRADRESGT